MITSTQIEQAAQLLLEARRSGQKLSCLPESCRPRDTEDAWQIQDRVSAQIGPVAGWKVGTQGADLIIAPLLASAVFETGVRLSRASDPTLMAEVEAGFRIMTPIGSAEIAHRADLVQAVEFVPALEVFASRFDLSASRASFLELLADGLANAGVVVGTGTAMTTVDARLAEGADITIDDKAAFRAHFRPHNTDPVTLLQRLAPVVAERGQPLTVGQIIITGSLVDPVPGTRYVGAHWPQIGVVEASFT